MNSEPSISVPRSEAQVALPVKVTGYSIQNAFSSIHRSFQWCFGGLTIAVMLAVLAVFPALNLVSLGYLMKASGRVATTGRLRDGCIGFRKAAHIGGILVGIWLCCWPIRLVMDLAGDAVLISPDQSLSTRFQLGFGILMVLTLGHILWALARGGCLRHFLWPAPWRFLRWMKNPSRLPLPHVSHFRFFNPSLILSCFKIGLAGFLGALVWLAIPVWTIYTATTLSKDPGILVSMLGGLLLSVVAVYLPFLQVQYASEPDWKNLFNLRKVRNRFLHAPFAFAVGLLVTLLFSVPLYLLKVELAPRELAWLPSLFFVVLIFPARLICGWAMHRSIRKTDRSHFLWRMLCRFGVVAIGLIYGMMIFFTQYLSWNGTWSLLEQHAFMVPAPWLSL